MRPFAHALAGVFTVIRFGSTDTFNQSLLARNLWFKSSFKLNFQHFDERVAISKWLTIILFLNANRIHGNINIKDEKYPWELTGSYHLLLVDSSIGSGYNTHTYTYIHTQVDGSTFTNPCKNQEYFILWPWIQTNNIQWKPSFGPNQGTWPKVVRLRGGPLSRFHHLGRSSGKDVQLP